MKKLFIACLLLGGVLPAVAQTYQELSEQSVECIQADSLVRAEELIKQALQLEPKNAHNALLFSNLGLVQRRLGRIDDAIESYTFALNKAPRAVPILLDRAALYLERGEINRAYVDYCQVLDDDRTQQEALLMRAYIYVLKHDYSGARADYNSLLKTDPQSYSGRLGLAMLEQKEGKYREALDLLNKLLVEFPDDVALYVSRAGVEHDMEHTELALIDIEKAIGMDASLPEAYLLRGDIYLSQKKKAAAKTDYEKAISLGVPPAELHDRLKQCR